MPSTAINFDLLARDRASDKFTKVGKSAEGAGSKLKSFAKVAALGAAGAAVGIAAFGKSAISAASDSQQSLGATQAVFGKFAKTVIKQSNGAATAYGLSANQFRESSNLIGSLLKNQGVAQDQLAGKTKGLVKLGADLSATYGGSAKDAVEALGAAFKGEFDPLEAYGVSLKQSTINTKAYALANVDGQSAFNKLSTAQQRAYTQQATMKILMLQTKDAQGQFAKQTNTLAEQQQILGAKFENLKAKVGSALLPVMTAFVGFLSNKGLPALSDLASTVSSKIGPAIAGFVTGIREGTGVGGTFASVVMGAGKALAATAGFLAQHKSLVIGLTAAMGALVAVTEIHGAVLAVQAAGGLVGYLKSIKLVQTATKTWAAVQWALNAALTANPIGLVIVGLVALGAGLVVAYKHSEKFRAIVTGGFDAVKTVASRVAGFFTSTVPAAFERVRAAASSVVGWIRGHWPLLLGVLTGPFGLAAAGIARNWGAIKAGASSVKNFIGDRFNDIVGLAKSLPGRISSVLGGAFSGLISSIKTALGWVHSLISAINSIPHPHVSLPKIPHVPGFASGVRNFSGGLALVGERGPELVSLPRGSSVYPDTQSAAMVGAINVNPARSGRIDGAQLQQLMADAMRQALDETTFEGRLSGDDMVLQIRRNLRKKGKADLFA